MMMTVGVALVNSFCICGVVVPIGTCVVAGTVVGAPRTRKSCTLGKKRPDSSVEKNSKDGNELS